MKLKLGEMLFFALHSHRYLRGPLHEKLQKIPENPEIVFRKRRRCFPERAEELGGGATRAFPRDFGKSQKVGRGNYFHRAEVLAFYWSKRAEDFRS